ncbi:MAG: hypothetical protein ACKPCM_01655, partial [Pseudanabaena sp.]
AVPPDTKLIAYLRVHPDLAAKLQQEQNDWYQLLTTSDGKSDRLGQSKKDDYGEVEIQSQKLTQRSPEPVLLKEKQELTVWLLSDVLIRDKRLRPSTSINDLASVLSDGLGTKITPKQDEENNLLTLIARQNRIESWQVRWGLPRPSLVGLAAGTCAVFTYETPPDPTKLSEIELIGIGNRTAEGYGQIRFNDPLLTQKTSNLPYSPKFNDLTKVPTGDLLANTNAPLWKYARIIEKAAWQDAIRRASLRFAAKKDKCREMLGIKGDKPTMSQLGSLRSIIGQLKQPETQTLRGVVTIWIENHLKYIDEKGREKGKWAGKDKLEPIQKLVSDKDEVWKRLATDSEEFKRLTLTETGEENLKKELWVEAVQTLVDACIHAHKRDLEKQDKSKQSSQGEV